MIAVGHSPWGVIRQKALLVNIGDWMQETMQGPCPSQVRIYKVV